MENVNRTGKQRGFDPWLNFHNPFTVQNFRTLQNKEISKSSLRSSESCTRLFSSSNFPYFEIAKDACPYSCLLLFWSKIYLPIITAVSLVYSTWELSVSERAFKWANNWHLLFNCDGRSGRPEGQIWRCTWIKIRAFIRWAARVRILFSRNRSVWQINLSVSSSTTKSKYIQKPSWHQNNSWHVFRKSGVLTDHWLRPGRAEDNSNAMRRSKGPEEVDNNLKTFIITEDVEEILRQL